MSALAFVIGALFLLAISFVIYAYQRENRIYTLQVEIATLRERNRPIWERHTAPMLVDTAVTQRLPPSGIARPAGYLAHVPRTPVPPARVNLRRVYAEPRTPLPQE